MECDMSNQIFILIIERYRLDNTIDITCDFSPTESNCEIDPILEAENFVEVIQNTLDINL